MLLSRRTAVGDHLEHLIELRESEHPQTLPGRQV